MAFSLADLLGPALQREGCSLDTGSAIQGSGILALYFRWAAQP